ncbi:MAG: spore coat-associated protein, partial [Solirubrobacteraceae bacterium]|nr:spore coat-associated protein [Solirubrobacteraceae bacterium]
MIAAAVAVLAATAALATTATRDAVDAAPGQQALASGALSMSNSRDGRAIFSASEVAPGATTTGTVTIRNTGSLAGSLALSPGVAETSGARGRALLSALRLRIADVTDPVESAVYNGGLEQLPQLALARIEPGSARSYRFSALLPDGGPSPDGAGDNLLQRASISVAYDWTLTEASAPPPAPPVGPPPVVPPPVAPP